MRSAILIVSAIYALSTFVAGSEQSELADHIVAFCKQHKGQQVGGGECAHLAQEALRASGGKPRGADAPNAGDYTWGKLVYTVERVGKKLKTTGQMKNVHPGDIVQIRNAKWQRIGADGEWASAIAPHHTAIVAAVEKGGKAIKVYEQNFGGRRLVSDGRFALTTLKEGWIRIYRPLPEGSDADSPAN